MMRIAVLFLFCISFITIGYSKKYEEYLLKDIAETFYLDSNNQISSPNQLTEFHKITALPAKGEENTAYWIHFKTPDANLKWVVEAYNFKTDQIVLYHQENGVWKESEVGWQYPYQKRDYDILNLVIDIPISYGNTKDFYLKVYSNDGPGFSIFLRDQQRFTNYAINENTYLGFFYGILMIIAIYNLILFVYLREKNHLFLAFYIFSSVLYSFLSNGFGYKYIWPARPEWNVWIDYFWTPLLFTGFYSLYAIDFIKIRRTYPRLYISLIALVIVSLLIVIIEFYLPINISILANAYMFPIIGISGASIYTYLKGNTFNRFFILGNSIVLISLVIGNVTDTFNINLGIVGVYGFDFAICAEIIILSLALADRILFLKNENDQARENLILQLKRNQDLQQKVNVELEQKVEERTVLLTEKTNELIEANSSLKQKTDQLNEINSKLDYDNWKLSKNIKSGTLARLKGEEISFEEFMRVFPDDLSCLRYLKELKWQEDFECIKCSYSKFKEIDKYYSRKCSKCGHIESVTSNTLLHRIRFSSLKAFYITYITFYKVKYTNEQLAKKIDLSENTCWRYRKKLSGYDLSQVATWEAFLVLEGL